MNTLLRLHRLCRYDAASTLLVILATQAYSQVSLAPVQYGTYISQLSPRPPHYIHHFALEHFNESSGFANEGVVKIHQDRHGFLWILTEKSLFRYDGQNFRSYTHNKDDSTSLHKPFYDNLHEDRHGVLWIVGTYGLQRYDAERDCFQRISIRTSSNQLLTTRILSVHEDIHTEHLWLGIGKEIWLIHREQYFVMRRHVCFQNSTSDFHQAQRIVADSAGRLWIASSESSSIHIVDSRVSQSHTTFHLDSNNHACFLIHQDSLWTSSSRGIILWSIRQQKPLCIYPLSEYSTPRSPATGLPQIPFTSILVRDMLRDSKGRVWVATDQGIIVIYPQTQQMQRFQSDPFNPRSLSTNDITALYEDRSGCIWIGEGVYGLHKYTPLQYQFQLYRHIPYTTNSLSNNYIRGIAEDPDGNLWVGTQFGGLNHLNRRTGQWTRFYRDSVRSVSRLNITGNHIRSLCVDRYGILWVAVQGSSLCTLDTKHPERGFTA
ncbi:MAG: hypothetical protein NZ661_09875, partial [Candidatus Kapabacteria bacterium]|nr:hypothetical protein [Candidatus Kapabacteria bacterium]